MPLLSVHYRYVSESDPHQMPYLLHNALCSLLSNALALSLEASFRLLFFFFGRLVINNSFTTLFFPVLLMILVLSIVKTLSTYGNSVYPLSLSLTRIARISLQPWPLSYVFTSGGKNHCRYKLFSGTASLKEVIETLKNAECLKRCSMA